MKKYVVIGGLSSEDLAQKISKELNTKFLKTELKIFSDGESKIKNPAVVES